MAPWEAEPEIFEAMGLAGLGTGSFFPALGGICDVLATAMRF